MRGKIAEIFLQFFRALNQPIYRAGQPKMKTLTILLTLLMGMNMSFADTRTDFYANAAEKAGKAELAAAYKALGAGPVTPDQDKILRAEVASFRVAGHEEDAKFVEGKLGAKAIPTTLPQPEPVKTIHSSLEKGREREFGTPAHRDKLDYQVALWSGLRDKAPANSDERDAFTSYAQAYVLARKAYDGSTVTDEEKRTYGPILAHFEAEARERGFPENANAIKLAIERGGFLRTLDTPAYSASATPATPAPAPAATASATVPAPAPAATASAPGASPGVSQPDLAQPASKSAGKTVLRLKPKAVPEGTK